MAREMYKTRFYSIWCDMRNRCMNPNNSCYRRYGGRGIKCCERWNEFDNFKEDMLQGYKKNLTLDRIDNNSGYSKENCRWAGRILQANNRSTNRFLEMHGDKKSIMEWSKTVSIDRRTITQRIENGWSVEKALTTLPGFSWRRSYVGNEQTL